MCHLGYLFSLYAHITFLKQRKFSILTLTATPTITDSSIPSLSNGILHLRRPLHSIPKNPHSEITKILSPEKKDTSLHLTLEVEARLERERNRKQPSRHSEQPQMAGRATKLRRLRAASRATCNHPKSRLLDRSRRRLYRDIQGWTRLFPCAPAFDLVLAGLHAA